MPTPINKIFDKIHTVPQIPEVVHTLMTQFDDPNISFNAVAKNIEKEQMISLKVLRLVNSAHFGLSRKIATIQEALVMIGMNQLRTLVIASGISSAIPHIEGVNLTLFWQNSFRTATYAKWLAAESNAIPDLAFTAGLINGLGMLLIHMGAPETAKEIDAQIIKGGEQRVEIEKRLLGYTSEKVCAELCKRWRFSPELIEVVEQCGEPLAYSPLNKEACAVFVAQYVSNCMDANAGLDGIKAQFPYETAAVPGFSEDEINQKLPELIAIESNLDGLLV